MKTTPAIKILHSPIAEWPQKIHNTKADLQDIETELSGIIQRSILLHDYVSYRYNTGGGDQGHSQSAKHANKALLRVRTAMGYSYPKNLPMSIQP